MHFASAEQVLDSQSVMKTIGARATKAEPGLVEIELPFADHLLQQHGFVHAGVITTIVDSACGFAAMTLLPDGWNVLTVEFKVNLLAPAKGDRFVARGRVVKGGKTLTVCQGEVSAFEGEKETPIALMQATMINLAPRT